MKILQPAFVVAFVLGLLLLSESPVQAQADV